MRNKVRLGSTQVHEGWPISFFETTPEAMISDGPTRGEERQGDPCQLGRHCRLGLEWEPDPSVHPTNLIGKIGKIGKIGHPIGKIWDYIYIYIYI